MKRYIAIFAAAALILASTGCTAVKHYRVDDSDNAYSRVLYPDGEYYSSEDEEEEDEDEQNEPAPENEPTEHKKEEEKHAESSKKEDKKAQPSSAQSSSKSSSRAPARVSAAASSKTTSSRISSDTDLSSDSDVNEGSDTDEAPAEPPVPGKMRLVDIFYDAGKDYIALGDSEEDILALMGEPANETLGEDGEKKLTFTDCVMTFRQAEDTQTFVLHHILMPFESYYETSRGIMTEMRLPQVLSEYGEPTEIVPFEDAEPDSDDTSEPISDEDVSAQTDTDSAAEQTDTDTEYSTDDPSSEPAQEDVPEQHPDGFYYYTYGDKALVFCIAGGQVVQIEICYVPADQE